MEPGGGGGGGGDRGGGDDGGGTGSPDPSPAAGGCPGGWSRPATGDGAPSTAGGASASASVAVPWPPRMAARSQAASRRPAAAGPSPPLPPTAPRRGTPGSRQPERRSPSPPSPPLPPPPPPPPSPPTHTTDAARRGGGRRVTPDVGPRWQARRAPSPSGACQRGDRSSGPAAPAAAPAEGATKADAATAAQGEGGGGCRPGGGGVAPHRGQGIRRHSRRRCRAERGVVRPPSPPADRAAVDQGSRGDRRQSRVASANRCRGNKGDGVWVTGASVAGGFSHGGWPDPD